jgi:hypothetical protein
MQQALSFGIGSYFIVKYSMGCDDLRIGKRSMVDPDVNSVKSWDSYH